MTTLIAFLLCIGILVSIHEYGHYWVARRCGVKVLRFSFGFGPVLASRSDKNGTEWAFSAIPLGGYVKMLDTREAPVAAHLQAQTFNSKSLSQRSAIVLAGPLANLLLAIVVITGLNMWGTAVLRPIIGKPTAGSPAATAQLQQGDEITKVGQASVAGWSDVRWALLDQAVGDTNVEVRRRGATVNVLMAMPKLDDRLGDNDLLANLGLAPDHIPFPAILGDVAIGSAAEKAGLQKADLITEIDNQAVVIWTDLTKIVQNNANKPLAITIKRDGQLLSKSITPTASERNGKTIGVMGVRVKEQPDLMASYSVIRQYDLLPALGHAIKRTWDLSWLSLTVMGKMLIGQASLSNLSGPITMADYAGQTASIGWNAYLGYLALISISIGVLNLLPVPMLDGGHLMYHLAEWIRGKPLSDASIEVVHKIGFALLLMLMGIAFYNDLIRYFFKT